MSNVSEGSDRRLDETRVTCAGASRSARRGASQSAEECVSAAFEGGLARLAEAVEQAALREQRWLDRVRAALVALLGFLEDEPESGRVLLLEPFARETAAFERARREQRVLGMLTGLLDDGSPPAISETMPERQLTAELVIGGVVSVIRARISEPEGNRGSLVELAPSLVSFIALAYLGQAAASAELVGANPCTGQVPEAPSADSSSSPIPVTHRTRRVLASIASAPRSSNREIAAAAGLGDDGQTSHLLRRLAQRRLIEKVSPRSGSRRENAWVLTPCGRRVIELLGLAGSTAATPVSADVSVREAA